MDSSFIVLIVCTFIVVILTIIVVLINVLVLKDKKIYSVEEPDRIIDIKKHSGYKTFLLIFIIIIDFLLIMYGTLRPFWVYLEEIRPGLSDILLISIPISTILFVFFNIVGYMTAKVDLDFKGFSRYDIEKNTSHLFLFHTIHKKGVDYLAPENFWDGVKRKIQNKYEKISLKGTPKSIAKGHVIIDGSGFSFDRHTLKDFKQIEDDSWIGEYYQSFGINIEQALEEATSSTDRQRLKSIRLVAEEQADLIKKLNLAIERLFITRGYEAMQNTLHFALADEMEKARATIQAALSLKNMFCGNCGSPNFTGDALCSNCKKPMKEIDISALLGIKDVDLSDMIPATE